MGKQIDFTQPLSAEDRAWAEQFPSLYGGMLEANAAQFPPEDDETLDGADDDEAPYTEWTIAELQTEVRRRNAEESKALAVPSKKADLVKVLETDDEASEAPPV